MTDFRFSRSVGAKKFKGVLREQTMNDKPPHANFDFLNTFSTITKKSFYQLQAISEKKGFQKNELILYTGNHASKVYQLNEGIVRIFSTSKSGKERIINLYRPTCFFGPLSPVFSKNPSPYSYQALTPCKVYEMDIDNIYNLCSINTEISNLYAKVLERVIVRLEQRHLDYISLNATEYYLKLKQDIPDIDNLIPQYQIASFLNITPVQLSRIRRKLVH